MVVRLLLGREGVEPDSKNIHGRTPLLCAARFGHEEVVRLLLERNDVDPRSTDNWGGTPLSRAKMAMRQSCGLLTPLTSEHLDNHLPQPLLQAAENGDEAAVRLLLERDGANLNITSSNAQTALSGAAWNGHNAGVQLLLEQDGIDPESKCLYGRMPLTWAADNRHDTVVQLLLKKRVEPNSKSSNGRTPLSWAAEKGHETAMRQLLEQHGIDVENKDVEFGQAPL